MSRPRERRGLWAAQYPALRVQWYVRARMHRRIFWWFGASILLSALFVVMALHYTSGGEEPAWRREANGARTFVMHRFAEVWDDPARRHALAQSLADDLGYGVHVTDAGGRRLDDIGATCKHPITANVERDGVRLGAIAACSARTGGGLRFAGALAAGILVMWAVSGRIARRIARPLGEVARAAEALGRGDLRARVRLRGSDRHGEVRVLADVLNEMASRLERQLADQRALLATVSHEIRTPLARMRLLAELARDKASELAEIDREIVGIDALVADLLASSRLDFDALTRTRLDATTVAQDAVERSGVDPSVLVVETPHVPFDGDATLASRAVTNLIDNAVRHAGGPSAVRVVARGGMIAFEVDDDGPGFLEGEEAKVFEPFYKRPQGAAAERGSVGLGLALVRRIAEAHGGRAYAATRAEGGARVGIELPRAG